MLHDYAIGLAGGPVVVKYGGNAMPAGGGADPVIEEIAALHRGGTPVVVVHGGGPEIDRALQERGIATQRIDGMRVTDAATLETTEFVLCATVNKRIVRALVALGVRAAGISGQDGPTLLAEAASASDLGFVGTIVAVEPALVRTLLEGGFLPVVAPLAVARDGAHAYNVNADLAAGALAAALGARAFVAITNVRRVFRDPDDPASGIDELTLDEATAFAASEACRSSMKPKLAAAIAAVAGGAQASYIAAAGPGSIAAALAGDATILRAAAGTQNDADRRSDACIPPLPSPSRSSTGPSG